MRRVEEMVDLALGAARTFRGFDQQQTDRIVRAVYLAALDERVRLAKMAHEETGMGRWEHKVIKNVIATQLVYEDIKDQRTVGVIASDLHNGIVEVAQPVGPILAFVPVTNPTSTMLFKAIIALKTRNPLIVSPHQAARRSTAAAAELCYRAALQAGAPEHCIQWLGKPSPGVVDELMTHRRLALILATGTDALVRKAQTSGTPTIGVGPGNVPVYLDSSADFELAVRAIMESKTLDNGTVCASEQSLVVQQVDLARVVEQLERQGAHLLSPAEAAAVGAVAYDPARGMMTPQVVGQSVQRIAELAGISVPQHARLLVARLEGVGRDHPLSAEILAPVLGLYAASDVDDAISRCAEITRFGGVGHTAVLHADRDDRDDLVEPFSRAVEAGRVLVNMPAVQGALGGMVNVLHPSWTLSCGAGGNNITADNITARHLLNTYRITRPRPNPRWASMPMERYLDESQDARAIEAQFNRGA